MIIFNSAVLIPALLTVMIYFLLKIVLLPHPSLVVALCAGSFVSLMMQLFRYKPYIFYIPLGFWLGLLECFAVLLSRSESGTMEYAVLSLTVLFALVGTVLWIRRTFSGSRQENRENG